MRVAYTHNLTVRFDHLVSGTQSHLHSRIHAADVDDDGGGGDQHHTELARMGLKTTTTTNPTADKNHTNNVCYTTIHLETYRNRVPTNNRKEKRFEFGRGERKKPYALTLAPRPIGRWALEMRIRSMAYEDMAIVSTEF